MPVEIPVRSDVLHYEQQIQLDGVTYTLRFRHNSREDAWYMSLYTEDGTALAIGVKIVVDFPLAARLTDSRRPSGRFVAVDTSGVQRDPGELDLGDRVKLYYFQEDELPLEEFAS